MAFLPFYQRKVAGKANHALNLMTSLEQMKKKDFLCDFTIKVGNWSFPVHRTVLAACSAYFEAMFSSEMKEVREGFVDMKGVEPLALGKCVEFMYSGEISLRTDDIEGILHTSNLLQIEELTSRCLNFLKTNLSSENCLFAVNMSRLYGRNDVTEKAIDYTRENFEAVVSTEMFPFVSARDLTHYLKSSNCNYAVLWKAIIGWLTHNGENSGESFEHVVSLVNADMFPFEFLFNTALDDLATQNCNRGVDLVLDNIFSNLHALELNLNLENCFGLHQLNRSRRNSKGLKSADNVIINYFAKNLECVVDKTEFFSLKKADVLDIFHTSLKNEPYDHHYLVWNGIKKWVSRVECRNRHFPELFRVLKLECLPCDFIRNTLLPDELVSGSRSCYMRILETISRRLSRVDEDGRYAVPCVAMLNNKTRKIEVLEVQCRKWTAYHQCSGDDHRRIASVKGQLFSLGEKFSVLDPDGSWRETAPLKRQPCPWCQLTTFRGCLYIVEGKNMSRYDPKFDQWTENLPGCALVMGFFVASDGKYIYAMGGHNAKKYDSMTQKWSNIAPMRIQRYDASAATLNGLLYVMGGTQFGKLFKSVECYDLDTDLWSVITCMQEPRSHFHACVVGNRLYAVGGSKRGEGLHQPKNDSVEVYDPDTGQWKIVTQMQSTGSRVLASYFELDVTDLITDLATSLSSVSKD